jgi:hypothetical protein
MTLVKFSRREVGGPAQHLRARVGERKWVNGGMISDSRSLLLAGECSVVTTGTIYMCRQDELADAIRPSGAAVVEIYYVAHLACCFMQ